MEVEKAGQGHASVVRQVPPLATLDLGEIRLADRCPQLQADGLGDRLLGHLPIESSERPFNRAEVAKLFTDGHNGLQYQYCDLLLICQGVRPRFMGSAS